MPANRNRLLDTLLSLFWPVLIIGAGAFWLLLALGRLPPVIMDLVQRGLPVALVAFGLMLLLGRRLRLGNLIALVLSSVLLGGVMVTAYSQQSGRIRQDYIEEINQVLGPEVRSVRLNVSTLLTEIELRTVPSGQPSIFGEFTGSRESLVSATYRVEGSVSLVIVQETQRNAIPSLDAIGRGKLVLAMPAGLTLDELSISGREGNVSLDAAAINLRKLTLNMQAGNLTVKLSDQPGLIGDLKTGRGEVIVEIPKTLAAQITLRGAGADNPQYSDTDYILGINKVLVPRRTTQIQMQLAIDTPGRVTIR